MTQPEHIYRHDYTQGDVLIWDERATMHRAVAWDYKKPRVLASLCVSVTAADGLEEMRPT